MNDDYQPSQFPIILNQAERDIENLDDSKKILTGKAIALLYVNVFISMIIFSGTFSLSMAKGGFYHIWISQILFIALQGMFIYWPIYSILKPKLSISTGLPPFHFGQENRNALDDDEFMLDLIKFKQGCLTKGNAISLKLCDYLSRALKFTFIINGGALVVGYLLFI